MPRIYKPFNKPNSKRPLGPDERREYDLARARAYKTKNKKRMKAYRAAYYANNKELAKEQLQVWVKANPDKKSEYDKRYRGRYPEKVLSRRERYKPRQNVLSQERYWTDISYRISKTLRASFYQALCLGAAKKNCSIRDLIGCTTPELIAHIERQFKSRMTWDNYGKWEVDHIRPCSSFDLTNLDDQRQCFHFTNLRPVWRRVNRAKSDKLLFLI